MNANATICNVPYVYSMLKSNNFCQPRSLLTNK